MTIEKTTMRGSKITGKKDPGDGEVVRANLWRGSGAGLRAVKAAGAINDRTSGGPALVSPFSYVNLNQALDAGTGQFTMTRPQRSPGSIE